MIMITQTMFQFPVFLLLLIPTSFGAVMKIDPGLQKKIDKALAGATWNIIILFKEDPKLLTPPSPQPTFEESYISVYNSMLNLKKFAAESQAKVISKIQSFTAAAKASSATVRMKFRWCTNTVSVYSASTDLVNLLGDGENPEHENITGIVEDAALKKGGGVRVSQATAGNDLLDKAWGLNKIDAKTWWDAGFDGSGVIVGHIDEGVDINHPSLKYNWVGKGDGWYAPSDEKSKFPYEMTPGAHGTHTLGTFIGRGNRKAGTNGTGGASDVDFYGVGVAPGARWISCGTCNDKYRDKDNNPQCLTGHVADCLDFMYCPNDKNKCLYRPNVISVSSGCLQDNVEKCVSGPVLDPCIRRLRNYGVIPVFAAGNGQYCQTIDDPADNEDVIGVGNVDEQDVLHPTSSKGPPEWRYNETVWEDRAIFKPDIIAPGTNIISTITSGPEGKFEYAYMTGSSMAAPHVAGAIALILSRTRDLSFEDIRGIVRLSVVNNSQLRSRNPEIHCGGKPDKFFTNHKFGFGRLRLPDLNDELMTKMYKAKAPTRPMPPPPDFSPDPDAAPRSVPPMMVGVVILMAAIPFLMNAVMEPKENLSQL